MDTHVKVLGVLYLVLNPLGVCAANQDTEQLFSTAPNPAT